MNYPLVRAGDRLALALKQTEQAQRNLIQVQAWAERYSHQHLGQGTLDLVHRLSQLTADLRSLVAVVYASGKAEGVE